MFKSTGKKISIDKDKIDDPFCRYQMSEVILKDEGFGNGLRTVFVNLEEIANELQRDKVMIMAYLSSVLGCKCITEKGDNMRWILYGRYTKEKIQECIYDFILACVLCTHCHKPETKMEIENKNDVVLKCSVCSKTSFIIPNKHTMKILKLVTK